MGEVTWALLPQDLMVLIFSRFPIPSLIKLKVVCKQWNTIISSIGTAFRRNTTIVPVSSTPAFIVELRYVSFWNRPITIFTTTLWMVEGQKCNFYRLPLDFFPTSVNVIAACKSIVLCCKHNGLKESPAMYVCNPVTKSWRQLPSPSCLKWWDFVALSFDSAARQCKVLLGRGFIKGELQSDMEIEMYDSSASSWTKLHISTATAPVCPRGEGNYHKGRFYWINANNNRSTNGDVVGFNVQERSWHIIQRPGDGEMGREVPISWCLSGVDGRLMLVYKYKGVSLWRMEEDCGDESKMKWVAESRTNESGIRNETWPLAAVNESGWSLVYLPKKNGMVVLDEQGKMVRRIEIKELKEMKMVGDDGTSPSSLRAFEANNVWWP
ncbi:hypothetical protein SUGI_0697440 [Cryptomeria japonica]|nr:hypothetical protein SUGI_0697440 [Cryptomeria japonica]